MQFKSPKRALALELLQGIPDGAFAADLRFKLGYESAKDAAKLLSAMVVLGHIGSVPEGTQQSARRVRYFAPEHRDQALRANRAGKGKTWGMGRAAARTQAQIAAGFAAREAREAVMTGKTKVTVAPTPVDMRFKVERPEPYFTAMRPGQYVEHDSAIARAYGAVHG